MVLLALGPLAAEAGPTADPGGRPLVWVGGKVVSGIRADDEGVATIGSEIEADGRVEAGILALRADLDVQFAPVPLGDAGGAAPRATAWPPEALFVRIGRGAGADLRAGVTVPEIGAEAWDRDQNDLVSYSLAWELENGQMLGVEPGVWVGDDLRLFGFAGQDLAWRSPTFGGGLSGSLGTSVSTWSGGFWLPQEDYLLLISGNQVSVVDEVWLTAEVDAGSAGGRAFVGGQLGLTVDAGFVGGAVRFEHQRADRRWLARRYEVHIPYPTAMTFALRLWARDAWGVVAEVRELLGPGGPAFSGTVLVTARTPGEPEQADLAR